VLIEAERRIAEESRPLHPVGAQVFPWDKTLALRLGFAPQLEGSGGEQKFVIVLH
jgi:hypothetical protein